MTSLLALDFDGVVCDSVDECLVTSYNAYGRALGRPRATLDAIPEAFRAAFRRWRYLVRPARRYWLLTHGIETDWTFTTQAAFDARAHEFESEMAAFQAAFDAERHALRHERPDEWLALHGLYDAFAQGWDRVRDERRVYVVTMKDAASVRHLSEAWSLGIDPGRIWGRDVSESKPASVAEICRIEGVTPDAVAFVDDHPVHLDEMAPMGAGCYWASWGYHAGADVPGYPHLATLADLPAP